MPNSSASFLSACHVCTLWHNFPPYSLTKFWRSSWLLLIYMLLFHTYYHYTGEFLSRILRHQAFVILSILSSLSSSANNAGSCDFLNNSSSKSHSNQMLSLPELRDNATYRFDKSSAPV